MRNRIEVGEPTADGTGMFKQATYKDTFGYYAPPIAGAPDPIVLDAVRRVFDAPGRSGDPLDGGTRFVSLEAYAAVPGTREVQRVEWKLTVPTPVPGTPPLRDTYGLVFYKIGK